MNRSASSAASFASALCKNYGLNRQAAARRDYIIRLLSRCDRTHITCRKSCVEDKDTS